MDVIINAFSVLLKLIFSFTGDWGVTVVFLTVLVRTLLLPVSIKQRKNLEKQQVLSKKMEDLKVKFKNDKQKLESEMSKLSAEGAKNMLGCLVVIIQLPVMYSLYKVFSGMPIKACTVLVPWVSSLKLPDTYFILPIIAVIMQLLPNILVTAGALKTAYIPKVSKSQVFISTLFTGLFLLKAPLTIGIYMVASNLFSAIEQVVYGLFVKRKQVYNAA